MRHSLLLLACAAGLGLTASCSNDAKTTTTETTTATDSTTVTTTTTTTVDTTHYGPDAETMAQRVANDLTLTDTVVSRKVRTVYRKRAHQLAAAEARYAADTTGRYAALRAANDEADREVKSLLNDPARYKVYEQNRAAYYEGTPYTVVVVEPAAPKGPAVVKVEHEKDGDVKIKYADGSKVKVGEDGDRKVKHADGTKVKSGDDGYKVK